MKKTLLFAVACIWMTALQANASLIFDVVLDGTYKGTIELPDNPTNAGEIFDLLGISPPPEQYDLILGRLLSDGSRYVWSDSQIPGSGGGEPGGGGGGDAGITPEPSTYLAGFVALGMLFLLSRKAQV